MATHPQSPWDVRGGLRTGAESRNDRYTAAQGCLPRSMCGAASGLDERLRDAVAREQEFRGEAIPEVDHELAAQGEERAPPMLRNRPIGPTPLEREQHCRTHEPHRAWCHVCIAGRGCADPHASRNASENGLPVVGVDCGYLWSRSAENTGDVVKQKMLTSA